MFKDSIPKPTIFTSNFRTSVTDGYFEQYASDDSLFMVCVALLYNRVKDFKVNSRFFICPSQASFNDAPWALFNDNKNKNIYSFNWIEGPLDTVDDVMSDGTSLPAVEKFVLAETKRNVKVRVYSEYNTVNICMEKIDTSLYHFMISFLSLYFPIFKEKPLTKQETDLMRTLSLKTSTNFRNQYNEMVKSSDFARFILKIQLTGFEKKIYKVRVTAAENEVNDKFRTTECLLRDYKKEYEKYQEALIRYEGIKSLMNSVEEKTELEEYLLNNKNLVNISVNDSKISFIVKTYLFPYLASYWKTMDRAGAIYTNLDWITKEEMRLLLTAIFSEKPTLKLKMCAYFELDYFGSEVTSKRGFNFVEANKELKDYLPNTHLNKHNCFGQNRVDVLQQLQNGDVIGAIECCINVAQRININESYTFQPMIDSLIRFEDKCLETKDGISMTPKEAVEYLKGLQNG